MGIPLENERYTYSDYYSWDDDVRRELIDGVIFDMSPAPFQKHQDVLAGLFTQIYQFLKGKPCRAFVAPFDVRLNPESGDDTVVQPDVLVVCDSKKLDGKCCVGAPDFIIEILSPSTAKKDRFIKFRKYLEAGVREYWIVDPEAQIVQTYVLRDGEYISHLYGDGEAIRISVLEGCTIELDEVFDMAR